MSHKIVRAKLWMDGSSRVTVTLAVDTPSGIRQSNLLIFPEDRAEHVISRVHAVTKEAQVDFEKVVLDVLQAAQSERNSPESQKRLKESLSEAKKGADKSREALMGRIRVKKEKAFRLAVQDLMSRGLSAENIHDLVQNAIVEGIHEG
jgi:intergrase/recombinase